MVIGYSEVILGTAQLRLTSLSRNKVEGSIKQQVGGSLVRHRIPGRTIRDWDISASGVIYETSTAATTLRKSLEAYDDLEAHHYDDGLITGSFIVSELTFNDEGDNPLVFEYKINLIEYNQA